MGTCIINLDEYKSIGTHGIALYMNGHNVGTSEIITYFDSFGFEHIPKEIKKFMGNRNIATNIFRIQVYNSIICVYFGIEFIDLMMKGKSLIDY